MKSIVFWTPPSRSNHEGSEVTYVESQEHDHLKDQSNIEEGWLTAAALYLVRTMLKMER